jgi:YD repeat-containing protein
MNASRLAWPLLAAVFALVTSPGARAGEAPVKDADVPKAVAEAVAKKYPGSVVKSWAREEEDKHVAYEAKVEVTSKDKDGKASVRQVEAMVGEDGKILAEEEIVGADALPEIVRKAIEASKYAKATIGRIERIIVAEKAENTHFEIVFEADGKKHEVTFDAAGKVLEDEDAEEGEEHEGGMEGKDGKEGGMEGKDCKPPEPGMATTPAK